VVAAPAAAKPHLEFNPILQFNQGTPEGWGRSRQLLGSAWLPGPHPAPPTSAQGPQRMAVEGGGVA